MSAGELKPWPAGTVCPAEGYSDFAAALNMASHHYADDSGKEWGAASSCMENAAGIAVSAAWPYWAMKRMFAEIAPLPSFDSFMPFYCRRLLTGTDTAIRAQRDALLEALEPSGHTKAAYHGEFAFDVMVPDIDEDNDELIPMQVYVPWTTVKEIMAAIRSRALAQAEAGK